MSATTYLQAWQEAYATLANSAAVPSRLWSEQVPEQEQSTYPRVELALLGDQPKFDVDGQGYRTVRSRLTVFDTTLLGVENMIGDGAGTIGSFFNTTRLSITGKNNRLWPGAYSTGIDRERSKEGQPVYFGSLEHTCEMQ